MAGSSERASGHTASVGSVVRGESSRSLARRSTHLWTPASALVSPQACALHSPNRHGVHIFSYCSFHTVCTRREDNSDGKPQA